MNRLSRSALAWAILLWAGGLGARADSDAQAVEGSAAPSPVTLDTEGALATANEVLEGTATVPAILVSQLPPRAPTSQPVPQPPVSVQQTPGAATPPPPNLGEIVAKLVEVVDRLNGRLETVERELAETKAKVAVLESAGGGS